MKSPVRVWRSLRVRLLLAVILVVLVAVSVTAFVAFRRTSGELERFIATGDEGDFRRFAFVLARSYSPTQGWQDIQAEIERLGQITDRRIVVTDAQGTVVGDSEQKLIGKPIGANWPAARLAPSALILAGDIRVGALYVGPRTDPNEAQLAFLANVNRSLLFGALSVGLAAVLIALFLSGRIFRPVEQLTAAAQRMEKGDLTVRVPANSNDEIGQLAHAFNAMAGSLSEQEQLRRNMVGDVAHELRTPLTNLRGYLEAARDGLITPDTALVDNLYEETMLLSRLVTDLQELAQAEAGQLTLVRQPTALAALVEQAIGMLHPRADAKDITLRVNLPDDLPQLDIDPERIGQVLRNLLNNAIAYTPEGGEIGVSAARQDDRVTVSVRDTGEGIAAEHLPHIFDRFYRADRSRARASGGAGLGLAIVRQLVLAHGGNIAVESVPGRGTVFTFTLPVAAPR